jgi:20S proteasome alpha/beta subunit
LSTVILIRAGVHAVLCSDGLEVRVGNEEPEIRADARKVFEVPGHAIGYAYTGVVGNGEAVFHYLCSQIDSSSTAAELVERCAGYLAGMNDAFAETPPAEMLREAGYLPLTGVILAGYFAGQRLFHAILPDGDIITPQRYVVFSMAEAEISEFLDSNVDDSTDVPVALDLASVAIQMAVSHSHSNDRESRAVLSPTHMTFV